MGFFCFVFFLFCLVQQCAQLQILQRVSGARWRLETATEWNGSAQPRKGTFIMWATGQSRKTCILSTACWPHNKFLFSSLQPSTSVPLHDSNYLASRHAANTNQLLYWAHLMNTLFSNIATAVLPVTIYEDVHSINVLVFYLHRFSQSSARGKHLEWGGKTRQTTVLSAL